jgi:hypothetical protein
LSRKLAFLQRTSAPRAEISDVDDFVSRYRSAQSIEAGKLFEFGATQSGERVRTGLLRDSQVVDPPHIADQSPDHLAFQMWLASPKKTR